MRIVAGKYRGKKLFTPLGKDIRPTSERAREAIFNILYSHLGGDYSNIDILDIFAGTGAFGFEALSRGFNHVCFIDITSTCVTKNAKLFPQEQNKIKILSADATRLPLSCHRYNLIFMDAPYAKGLTEPALKQLIDRNWLQEKALCIVEIRKDELFLPPEKFELIDERIYGLARIIFLRLR